MVRQSATALGVAVALYAGLASAGEAQPGPIYLVCETIGRPATPSEMLYKVPPASRRQVVQDIWDAGRSGLVSGPAEVWVIDTSRHTVENGIGAISYTGAVSDGRFIQASDQRDDRSSSVFRVDLLTGELIYAVSYPPESGKQWTEEHGGTLPTGGGWKQQCIAMRPPSDVR